MLACWVLVFSFFFENVRILTVLTRSFDLLDNCGIDVDSFFNLVDGKKRYYLEKLPDLYYSFRTGDSRLILEGNQEFNDSLFHAFKGCA